jgi:hypothetical protein
MRATTLGPMAQKEGAGPLIAIIVIVVILALGGLYYLVNEIKTIRASQSIACAVDYNSYEHNS